MQRVPVDAKPPCDFWNYFEKIPTSDFEGYDCSAGSVSYAWKDPSGRFQHVLIDSPDKDVFMVIVIDLEYLAVLGHH